MSYTLHGAKLSTCCARVLIVAAQIGVDVKLEEVDFAAIFTPEWAVHQPFNQMPYFEDHEANLELYESRAIAKYLAVKAGSDLVPKQSDLAAYGLFEQACSVENNDFDPAASGLAAELVFAKMFHNREPDAKRVEELKAKLAKSLDGYERVLAKTKYMAGDKLTVADLAHIPYGKMVADLGVAPALTNAQTHPNVARWWKEITSLPSVQKVAQFQAS